MGLNLCEIFYSLQGESTFAGLPCVFIRLSGCNLDCTWCDTPYAQAESTRYSIEEILEQVASFDCRLVEITGGEPLMQDATPNLAHALIKKGFSVLVETNGSRDISLLPKDCIKIVDIKCPSSNEKDSFLDKNIAALSPLDEIKFVIGNRDDYAYARTIIQDRLVHIQPSKIHLSPVFGQIDLGMLAQWIIEDHLSARLSLQQHKIIWDPEKRGV